MSALFSACRHGDDESWVPGGDLVAYGAKSSWLNQRFRSFLVKTATICLFSDDEILAVMLDNSKYCVQVVQNGSCNEGCYTSTAQVPLQGLFVTRTFGGNFLASDLPHFVSAEQLGWDVAMAPLAPCTAQPRPAPLGPVRHTAPGVRLQSSELHRPATKVLGMFHDTGLDFNGAVLYKHEALDLWPPLFLRYYVSGEWCVELGWCYTRHCFPAFDHGQACHTPWQGCRQGVEVMCFKDSAWSLRDWIRPNADLRQSLAQILRNDLDFLDFKDPLVVLPGVHEEAAGLVRHRLLLGNYTGLKASRLSSLEVGSAPARRLQAASALRWKHVIVVRMPKASSSTLASVFVRVGRSLGHLIPVGHQPFAHRPRRRVGTRVMFTMKHETPSVAWDSWMATLKPGRPLVVTSLRQPFERCVSRLYHAYIDQEKPPSIQEKMEMLRRNCNAQNFSWEDLCCGNFQYHFLALAASESTTDLLARYDFIFITERFADSLLAFRARWNLTFAQLLHVQLKSSQRRQVCAFARRDGYTVKMDPGEKEILATVKSETGFLENNQLDLFLWNQANARLDAMLATYDKKKLEEDRAMLNTALGIARDNCQRIAAEMCIDCLHEDIGCAQDCLDRVAENLPVFVGNT